MAPTSTTLYHTLRGEETVRDVRLGHFTEVEFSPEDLEINRWWLRTDPPAVVQQTDEILREVLKKTDAEIAGLRGSGVV